MTAFSWDEKSFAESSVKVCVETTFRPTLAEDIEREFEVWWNAGAERERLARLAEEERAAEKEIAASLVDTLLDYDFRLMMLEEGAL